MVDAHAVLSTYLHGYGLFRSESELSNFEQEVVFLAAIRKGHPIPDTLLTALHAPAVAMVTIQGRPPADVLKAVFAAYAVAPKD